MGTYQYVSLALLLIFLSINRKESIFFLAALLYELENKNFLIESGVSHGSLETWKKLNHVKTGIDRLDTDMNEEISEGK